MLFDFHLVSLETSRESRDKGMEVGEQAMGSGRF